jgi:hypothetical protein
MTGKHPEGSSNSVADKLADPRLPPITAVVVDVAAAAGTPESQDAMTDFVWNLLERDYQIYLCSSTTKEGGIDPLADNSFAHPRLTWLHGEMTPSSAQTTEYPQLVTPTTLWVSDDRSIETWVRQIGLPFVSVGRGEASFTDDLHLSGWGQLAGLLDPGARALRLLADAVLAIRRSRPSGPTLVGIGGPPESGFERLAVDLKRVLEDSALPLVDLLDLSSFPSVGEAKLGEPSAFPSDPGERWLLDDVLARLANGETVYIENAQPHVPAEFGHHFPLYLSHESVVIVLGQALFQRAIRDKLHLAVLVEVGASETARRMYGIPEGQTFDPDFTRQYLAKDGQGYEEYLKQNQVVSLADIHVDGNSPRWFDVKPIVRVAN